MAVSLEVNGARVSVEVDPTTPLLWVLRENLNLPGTKFGCGAAQCGACTVLIDDVLHTGRSIRAGLDAMLSFGRPDSVQLMVLVDRRFSRIFGAMDYDAIGLGFGDKLIEILIEMFNDLGTDGVRLLSAFFPIR